MTIPGETGPYAPIACNKSYAWSDPDGIFSFQWPCGSHAAPWGYRILPTIQRMIAGLVNEQGMIWSVNGKRMTQQAGHARPADYQFHGTFNPVGRFAAIDYTDTLSFGVRVGTAVGHGRIRAYGRLALK